MHVVVLCIGLLNTLLIRIVYRIFSFHKSRLNICYIQRIQYHYNIYIYFGFDWFESFDFLGSFSKDTFLHLGFPYNFGEYFSTAFGFNTILHLNSFMVIAFDFDFSIYKLFVVIFLIFLLTHGDSDSCI